MGKADSQGERGRAPPRSAPATLVHASVHGEKVLLEKNLLFNINPSAHVQAHAQSFFVSFSGPGSYISTFILFFKVPIS